MRAHGPERRSPSPVPSQQRRLTNGARTPARENRGMERDDGAAAAKLADDEVPGETEGTNVLPMPNRVG